MEKTRKIQLVSYTIPHPNGKENQTLSTKGVSLEILGSAPVDRGFTVSDIRMAVRLQEKFEALPEEAVTINLLPEEWEFLKARVEGTAFLKADRQTLRVLDSILDAELINK